MQAMSISAVDPHIAAILESPAAPALAAELNSALEAEKKRRLQFYQDIDDDLKAEFINGEVIIHSPVKKEHTDATGFLYILLNTYVRVNQLGYVGYEKLLIALTRNDYEPDVVFFGPDKASAFQKGHWKYPAPDLVVEVLSFGTENRDRGIKLDDYAAHCVSEYWIIDPEAETVEQYVLHENAYKLHLKAGQGPIQSHAVPGFSIDIRAVFDEAWHLNTLKEMLG